MEDITLVKCTEFTRLKKNIANFFFALKKGIVLNKSAKWHCGRHTLNL